MEHVAEEYIEIVSKTMDEVSKAADDKEIYTIIENLFKDFTESDSASLFIFDKKEQLLYSEKDERVEYPMLYPEGVLGHSFLTKKSAIYNHLASEKLYNPEVDTTGNIKFRSQIIMPILERDNLLGIVRASRTIHNTKSYTPKDTALMLSLVPFLIKVIRTLVRKEGKPYATGNAEKQQINQQIKEIEKISSKNEEINSTMLFLANTVHDIRTPANSLYGFLELLEEQIEDTRLKEFIENAKESAEFINNLTDSILEQVKETHQIKTAKPVVVNGVKFFAQIANIFTANMLNKEINYLIHIDPSLPKEIQIDKLKLKRIIINLIGNAYKFTPKGKRIDFVVKFEKETKKIKLCVKDNGIGIDESRQKKIFEAFEQAEADTSEHFGGTGLGLSISSKYVSDLGGKLKLESATDKGSNFYFTIPVEVIDATPSQESFKDIDKKIIILTDNLNCIDAKNMLDYLVDLGMPAKNVTVSNTLSEDATHLFCFQHKLNDEVIDIANKKGMKILLVEEKLFSLSRDATYANYPIISENSYYGDKVHSSVFSKGKIKLLIVDDSKINITLLKAMLEADYCEIVSTLDGSEALKILKDASQNGHPFELIFLDEHMPDVSGSKIMEEYRVFEKAGKGKPIFAISITGDPHMTAEQDKLYDYRVSKPFKKEDIKEALRVSQESK